MNKDSINYLKSVALKAMISNDELMEHLVLKGCNAIDMIYKASSRASVDLDFSIEKDFDSFEKTKNIIQKTLEDTFKEQGYALIDFKFLKKPDHIKEDKMPFWGGYKIEFKIIEIYKYNQNKNNIENLRKSAIEVDFSERKKFEIDISKNEYCEAKRAVIIDGLKLYVYSPEMIVFEKLRAICQQTKEYGELVHSKTTSPRATDFFDIYALKNKLNLDLYSDENIDLAKKIFEQKHVPIELLTKMEDYRVYHNQGFQQVKETVYPNEEIKKFDYYFDYVSDLGETLFQKMLDRNRDLEHSPQFSFDGPEL